MYEIKLEQFSGPLEKLLELIEEQKLEINRVSLAAVTRDFLKYTEKLQGDAPAALLADFLVVAAKLVLIKSKTLLPDLKLTEEEEKDIQDLESRLAVYREFSARGERGSASKNLVALWDRRLISWNRPFLKSLGDFSFFYPPKNLGVKELLASMAALCGAISRLMPETSTIKSAVINLQEKIEELLERAKEAAEHSFKRLSERRSRSEVIVMFLAVLHLFRQRLIRVEQTGSFGDIIIKKM